MAALVAAMTPWRAFQTNFLNRRGRLVDARRKAGHDGKLRGARSLSRVAGEGRGRGSRGLRRFEEAGDLILERRAASS